MQWILEQALPNELERWRKDVFWYEFRTRKRALTDKEKGLVEVCRAEITRAWSLNSCLGSPCCPNEWLLECSDGDLLYFCSWDYFDKWDQVDESNLYFPGRLVTIRRWPITHRVSTAECTGDRISIPNWSHELYRIVMKLVRSHGQNDWLRCQQIPAAKSDVLEKLLLSG